MVIEDDVDEDEVSTRKKKNRQNKVIRVTA